MDLSAGKLLGGIELVDARVVLEPCAAVARLGFPAVEVALGGLGEGVELLFVLVVGGHCDGVVGVVYLVERWIF